MVPARKRSEECPICQHWPQSHVSEESQLCRLCVSQQPNPLQEQTVEEAAMPGQPSRAHARFRFPPAIHPRESPAATSVTARHLLQAIESSPRPALSYRPLLALPDPPRGCLSDFA